MTTIRELLLNYPELYKEFDMNLNDKTRDYKASDKVWWLGNNCQHSWSVRITDRITYLTGCPYCSGNKILTGFNDLATRNPSLALDWDFNSNGDLKPTLISPNSHKKVWWLGAKCGHSWETPVKSRNLKNYGCPVCSGRKILTGFNDLAFKNPEIASEWHPTKNSDLTPDKINSRSVQKIWWLGKCGHEWESIVWNRTNRKTGCPACLNRRTFKVTTTSTDENGIITLTEEKVFGSLQLTRPEIASEWHPTKNGNLTPDDIFASSKEKVWWVGSKCGHEWKTTVTARRNGQGCGVCSSKQILIGFNDLASVTPEVAKEWHPTKNKGLLPTQVFSASDKKAWWICGDGHEYFSSIKDRKGGHGCPTCSSKVLKIGYNDLGTTAPKLALEWHPTRNRSLTPQDITRSSAIIIWWLGKCGHEWKAKAATRNRGHGCPICCGIKILTGFNDLNTLNPKLAVEWHPTKNGSLLPNAISANSHKKAWWLCSKNHEWEVTIDSRNSGNGCPTCANKLLLVGFNDLATIAPSVASEWHTTKNGLLTAGEILGGTNQKVWWECSKGHEWKTTIASRVARKTGCKQCTTSGPEKEILEYITNLGAVVEHSNRKLLKGKELDLYIPSLNLAIEFNGVYWHNEANGKGGSYHYDKWLACKQLGINLLYIWEDDWTKDNNTVLRDIDILLQVATKEEALLALNMLSTTEQASTNAVVNGSLQSILHALSGSTVIEEVAPIFSYVVKSERVNQSELSDADLVRAADLPRIWDAGSSVWSCG